jgi:cytochrome o ubiquinol oxidase subunit 1
VVAGGASFVAHAGVAIGHTFNYKRDFHIPADEVVRGGRSARAAGAPRLI